MLGKICVIVGLVSTATALDINVSINKTQVLDILGEWANFSQTANETVATAETTMDTEIQSILEQAYADVMVNYAKVLAPLAKKFAKYINAQQPNDTACNETCITDVCFNPETWSMNYTCISKTCKCAYDDDLIKKKTKKLKKEWTSVVNTTATWGIDNAMQVQEAYRAYRMKVVEITMNADKLVSEQLATAFADLDTSCFDLCSTYYSTDLFGYRTCVAGCVIQGNTVVDLGLSY